MTTLAKNAPRTYEVGELNMHPMVATDIIYGGAAAGIKSTGYCGPLAAGDRFAGFVPAPSEQVDNSAGAAGALDVTVRRKGYIVLPVTGAVITDVRQSDGSPMPVYATDDDTFTFSPVGGVFVGFVSRWLESGKVLVAFDADGFSDPYAAWPVRETLAAASKTLDAEDSSKLFWVTVDSTITLPATATALLGVALVCGGALGTVQISASPDANDKIMGPDIAGANDKDLINTKATAQRGDLVVLNNGHADGAVVTRLRGTWATQG